MLLSVSTVLLMVPLVASAHSDESSFETRVGAYTVDIGYDPATAQAGERLLLDFKLLDAQEYDVAYDQVWVRVEQSGNTILATGVARATLGPTTVLLLTPSESGPLTISARYEKGGKPLAESSFMLAVVSEATSTKLLPLAIGLLALCIGAASTFLIMKRSDSSPEAL